MQPNFKLLSLFLFSVLLFSACSVPLEESEPEVTPTDGKIGVICIGMSNANLECEHFMETVYKTSDEINPDVVFVNCAVGGGCNGKVECL